MCSLTVLGSYMTFVYKTQSFVINPLQYSIEGPSGIVNVRPKTFSLLILLLQHPRELLSKDFLLETIWDDVAVGEQVLFQSIGEIRKLFQQANMIKTHPRKGYSWVADVERIESSELVDQGATNNGKSGISAERGWGVWPRIKSPVRNHMLISILGVFLIVGVALTVAFSHKAPTSMAGTVLILPVKNTIVGTSHNWVYLGAMDQLIRQVASTGEVVVMEPQYVLNSMQNAQLGMDYTSEDVSRLFDVSGAHLLVETELSGSVEDYRLSYKLHLKNTRKFGVLIEQKLDRALEQFAGIIAAQIGHGTHTITEHFHSEFNNALMARALEQKRLGNLKAASELLSSLISLENTNLTAHRLLGEVLIQLREYDTAKTVLLNGIQRVSEASVKEHAKLLFWLASAQNAQGLYKQSVTTLSDADDLAAHHHDWLYRAYIAQLQGQNYQQLAQLELAENAFKNALHYHGFIRCPIGTASTQLQLAQLFKALGRNDVAAEAFNQASNIISTRQLQVMAPLLVAAQEVVFSK